MSLIGCGSIHQGHERFSDDSRGRQEIFICLATLLYEQFLPIREVPRYRSSLHGDHFFLGSELLDKSASIRSKLPTAACWSREITEENLKQTCFMSKAKANSVPQLGNHSQYSSHVGALNLIDESRPLPVEANNSTIELHLAVEAKEKLSEYIESKSLPVEVKENFAIVNSKYGSLFEANHSFPNSCFETNSESISPVESIHSTGK